MHAAAGHGLLGVTIPKAWGGAGRDYVSYALAIEAIAQGERDGRGVAVGHQLARRRGHRARRARSAARALAAAAGDRRGDRRLRAVGAGRRHRRRESADHARVQVGRRLSDHRPEGLGRQRRGSVGGDRLRLHAARAARPGRHRVSRADGHAGHHAHRARRLARRARPRLHGSRARHRGRRRPGARATSTRGFRLAMWALQGGRVAIAAQALGIGEAALDEAIAYAKQREQFGQPIAQLSGDPVDARRHGHRARRRRGC